MVNLRRCLALGVVALAGLSLAGCDQGGDAVAYVNGTAIPQDDYLSLLEMSRSGPNAPPAGQNTLNQMVEQRLLIQEATHEGVAPTTAELQASLTELRQNPAVQEEISKLGLSDDQIIRLFIEPNMCMIRLMAKMAGIKDPDIQKYFAAHKEQLRQPEQVQARVLQVPDKKTAQEALDLVGKSTFASIIQTVKGQPVAQGGDPTQIVTLRKGGQNAYPQPVVDAAFATPKGQASKIIEAAPQPNFLQPQAAPAGKLYFVVYVENEVPPQEPSLNNPSTKNSVIQALLQERQAQMSPTAFPDLVSRLRQAATVSVVRPSVKSVEKPPAPTAPQGVMGGPPPSAAPAPSRPSTTVPARPSTAPSRPATAPTPPPAAH